LIDFGANSEESDSNGAVELYEMGENGLDNLFSAGMRKAAVIDKFIGSPQDGFLVALREVVFIFGFILTKRMVVGEGILEFVLILFILIHNCFI
jgi:hypothetical protein